MIVDGTSYDIRANVEVVRILEGLRASQERVGLIYGDTETGRAWGDVDYGRIGRSTGKVKVPLIINNTRSMGGPAVLEHCIVGIRASRMPHRWLYKHPNYQLPDGHCYHPLLVGSHPPVVVQKTNLSDLIA